MQIIQLFIGVFIILVFFLSIMNLSARKRRFVINKPEREADRAPERPETARPIIDYAGEILPAPNLLNDDEKLALYNKRPIEQFKEHRAKVREEIEIAKQRSTEDYGVFDAAQIKAIRAATHTVTQEDIDKNPKSKVTGQEAGRATPAHHYTNLLRDAQTAKDAIIVSEILKTKF
ncbi:MAG: hypothetical protein JJT94_00560 [Bernardetiaceae bacterium]|nr:hypothetical protein [Bernardetiaceae bacterium]